MYSNNSFLAIIPARGGSKSVPKKNIKLLGSKPLISYTFAEAIKVKELDYILVSTDDDEIAAVAKKEKVRVIKRPKEISSDHASTESALIHAINFLEMEEKYFDYVVVLEPTSPFRKSSTIEKCIKLISELNADSLLTLKKSFSNIGDLKFNYYKPLRENQPRRRQEREPFYLESSTVYVAKIDFLKQTKSLVSNKWAACVLDSEEEGIDINSQLDFYLAESVLKGKQNKKF